MKKTETCFVIMPFSETSHKVGETVLSLKKRDWDHIFERWIKRAVECYPDERLLCKRSAAQPGNFVRGIMSDLADSTLVIADLTGGRPNVYYELGVRHALRTGTIIITQHLSALPSDLHSYYAFEYRFTEKSAEYDAFYSEFEKNLHEKIRAFQGAAITSDSPVSDFLGLRHQMLLKSAEVERDELAWTLKVCEKVLEQNFKTAESIWTAATIEKEAPIETMLIFDTEALDIVYARMLNISWRVLPSETIERVMEVVNSERRRFQTLNQYMSFMMGVPNQPFNELFFSFLEDTVKSYPFFKQQWPHIVEAIEKLKLTITNKAKKTPKKRSRRK